jgi:hypothetical protein
MKPFDLQGKSRRLLAGYVALAMAWALQAAAQNYSINWFKVSGGGGTSSSTNRQFAVSGTIGQHDAGGSMTGGSYSVTGGFWSLVAAVQTPGAPLLSIQLAGANSVLLSWPTSSTTFRLEQRSNLGAHTWATVTNEVNVVGGQNQAIISPPTGSQFYRLAYP